MNNKYSKKNFERFHLTEKSLRRKDPIQFNVLYNEWLRGKQIGRTLNLK